MRATWLYTYITPAKEQVKNYASIFSTRSVHVSYMQYINALMF